jgi:tripartite-type tricarboxylate transporter receptor subunit TctC
MTRPPGPGRCEAPTTAIDFGSSSDRIELINCLFQWRKHQNLRWHCQSNSLIFVDAVVMEIHVKSHCRTNTLLARMVFSALALVIMTGGGAAQEYPSRPINIIVPFTAGGPNDVAARLYAEGLRRKLGQPVVIENRPGAGGVPAIEAMMQGEMDGYSLLMGGIAPLVLIPPIQKVRYDVEKDFVPLGLVWRSPQVFAVHPKLGIKTVTEFATYAKANPGKITVGSAGLGTVTHLANELFKREAGIEFNHVPYRSTANSLTDLLGGHIDSIFGDVALLKPHVQAGTLNALAVTAAERSSLLPDLATTAEVGFPAVRTEVWYGVLVSARAPAAVLARLKEATLAVQTDPAFRDGLNHYGIDIGEPGADSFARFLRSESERWTPIVQSVKMN